MYLLATEAMDKINVFKEYLNKFVKLTDTEFDQLLLPVIKTREFGKKEKLIKVGDIENYFNFIVKGLIRKYYKKGTQEIITQISSEGQFILCHESFYSRQPSEYTVEAIEPSTVISINYDDLEKVFASSKNMEHIGRLIITYMMVIKDRWQLQMVKMTPRERFLNFVTKNPQLMQRVPQKFLASFLHIKPETFSRFKHLIKDHAKSEKLKSITH